MLLYRQLAQTVHREPSRPLIRHLGKDLRASEALRKIAQLSYLYQAELGNKARVALLSSNTPAVPLSFLAFTNSRTVTIPLPTHLGFEELGKCLRQTQATHLGVSADRVAFARELLRTERLNLPIIEIERKQGGEYDASYSPPPENPPKETDTILLLRTAGTVGEAKFAAFDHRSLAHAATALRGAYRAGAADRFLTTLNWSHPFAWMHAMLFPLLGGSICTVDEGRTGPEFPRFLTEHSVTHLLMGAAEARSLLKQCAGLGTRLPRLKAIIVGPGGSPETLRELRMLAGPLDIGVVPTYGQTESLWAIGLGEITKDPLESTRLLAGLKAKIMDASGDEIVRKGKSRVGRLAVSGPVLMTAYQGQAKEENEKATRMAIRGTWLYTGDIAELSGEGETLRLRCIGRGEELLENAEVGEHEPFVSAEGIDPVAREYPGIDDAAGFVMKDGRGRRLIACAAVRPEGSVVREDPVLGHCRAKIDSSRAPEGVFFVDSIPRLAIGGAVNRHRLALQFNGMNIDPAKLAPGGLSAEPPPEPPAELLAEYALCSLADIHIGIPIPVTLHAFYRNSMIPFRPKGGQIDRHTYDRLELMKYGTLYVRSPELEELKRWSLENQPPLPSSADPELLAARRDAHKELLTLFSTNDKDVFSRRALEINRRLLKEVTRSGYIVRPLADLMALSKGTAEHSVNVSVLSVYLALHLGYTHELILEYVGLGALLHDLGRTKADFKDDDTPEQHRRKVEEHPVLGAEALSDSRIPRQVRMIVLDHHESIDGTGYPRKLKGSQIYDPAGIVAIADIFEKLVSQATGDIRTRYERALHKLEGDYRMKLDPYKLDKSIRVLRLSL